MYGVTSSDEELGVIADAAARTESGQVILLYGDDTGEVDRPITGRDLDKVAPHHPVMIGGHACIVNTVTAAKQWGPDNFQDHFVGTGPFLFKEWKRHEYILLEENPNYWGSPEFFMCMTPPMERSAP